MVTYVCDGEMLSVRDPPLDQDEVGVERMRYENTGTCTLKAPQTFGRIEILADLKGEVTVVYYDDEGQQRDAQRLRVLCSNRMTLQPY